MVKLTKIYTRGGDKGLTSLVTGERVIKSHPIIQAVGSVDELNSALGIVQLKVNDQIKILIASIQNDLFDLGADIATPFSEDEKIGQSLRVTKVQTKTLELKIDQINEKLQPLTSFILPGGSEASSYLHIARAITRRTERDLIVAFDENKINPEALKYLNRLSDLLFVLCRHLNNDGEGDVLWVPGNNQ
ncbi:MAG: cob(I)yrinic acid a,c-diamide adenosyltransferase [Sphingomonadales bacterium]